jgi:tRNA (cmo5U34)-methyltransferase
MVVVRVCEMSEPPLGYGLTMTPSRRGYEMGQFDWTPEVYLERIRAEIPGYDDLQDQAVAAIPFGPERVLELGMGTGETTRRLIEAHPEAWVVGLDASPDMVFRARKSYDDVQLARMEDPLPDGPWDLVISVLSVNQLDDEQKQNLCRQVKGQSRSLVIGDVFVGNQLENLTSWSEGEVTWRHGDLAVVRATY